MDYSQHENEANQRGKRKWRRPRRAASDPANKLPPAQWAPVRNALDEMLLASQVGESLYRCPEQCIELAMVGDTLTDKGKAVLGAISTGELAPGQGSQLITAIGALARVIELDDLERRISELESFNAKP